MRKTLLSFVISATLVEAFVIPQKAPRVPTTELQAKNDLLWKPMATFVAGLSLASQIATAQMPMPTNLIAAKVETMDFSMPSYDSATKERELSNVNKGGAPPSFNPFGDFEPSTKEDTSAAEKKAEAIRKEQEKKAEAEQKKKEEEEKQAEIERKKAEKEARLAAERQKQKEAAERAAAERAAAEKAEKAAAEKAKEAPKPTFSMPEVDTTSFKAPDVKVPEFKAPDLDFKAPDIKIPDFKAPDIKVPDMSKLSMPKFDMPKSDYIDIPKFDMPKGATPPKFDMPKDIPKFDMPKSMPSFGGGSKDLGDLAPQAERDQIARDKKAIFLSADQDAKELEAKARELRAVANAKKKDFKSAKDEACKDRPGGAILCLRNPFSTGF